MEENVLISIRDVSMNYGSGRQDAIEHVSVDVRKGEILALVGSNGSGKSTLMKGMLKLMPFSCGEMERKKGLKIGYMAQMHTQVKDFPATVREVVLSGTRQDRFFPFYTHQQRRAADEAMELMEVRDLASSYLGALSGGQMQRVLMARCVAGDPELLVLDEPTSALDPRMTHQLQHIFTRLRDERGVSVVVSTHDWHFVKEHADRVLVLDHSVEFVGKISDWQGREDEHTCHH